MTMSRHSAPPPDLRIVPVGNIHPHEDHDTQRAVPLINRIRQEPYMINPPIVAPMEDGHFVILDGANRCYAFSELNYPHILVQVSAYDSGYVELDTWKHIISGWQEELFMSALDEMDGVTLTSEQIKDALLYIRFRSGLKASVSIATNDPQEKNALLRQIVTLYQQNTTLNRTAMIEPESLWPLYPDAIAFIQFPQYSAGDILDAVRHNAHLPSGVTRHIIHGRALRVNYPMELLRNADTDLSEKNSNLQKWVQEQLANRRVRYYAETTYQFGE